MSAWRPIKLAPKDGKWIMVIFRLPGVEAPRGVSAFLRWNKTSRSWEDDDGDAWDFGRIVRTAMGGRIPDEVPK